MSKTFWIKGGSALFERNPFNYLLNHARVPPHRVGDTFEGGAGGGQKAGALRKELGDLERAEKCLDELILSSTTQLKQLTEYEDNQRYP